MSFATMSPEESYLHLSRCNLLQLFQGQDKELCIVFVGERTTGEFDQSTLALDGVWWVTYGKGIGANLRLSSQCTVEA